MDWDNPELYDIVLNMDNFSVDLATDAVLHIARTEEIKVRSIDVMKSLEMMGLAKRAEAALVEAGFASTSLSVSVLEPGRIRLTGTVGDQSNKTKSEEILKGVKGVESIDNQIRVVLSYHGRA